MKFIRETPTQTRRDTWVEIDLGALERNAKALRQAVPASQQMMAIVKADAYGHGAVMILQTLEASGIDMLGVASLDEALQIRKAGIRLPTLVIGVVPDWALATAAQQEIQLTVFDAHHLQSLTQAHQQTGRTFKVHVKVDTGMHRIGVAWEEAADFINMLSGQPGIQLEGVFSHFADTADARFTQTQLERWRQVVGRLNQKPRYLHIANSEGMLLHGHSLDPKYSNLVRTGIALFGYGPAGSPPLEPVMGVKGRIIRIHDVGADESVSYGRRFTTNAPTRIATVPLGYADGVPRILSGKIDGLLLDQRVPQAGVITMDQMMFDVTSVADAQVGDIITLVGADGPHRITLSDWAAIAQTIEYELMCGLRVRLPKVYVR
ncbi:MAG: alanine racemase [Candidatus Melainabacteria bacterium]